MNGEPLVERLSRKHEALRPYLTERLRRLFAAAEVLALDRGGKTLVSAAFHLSRVTLDRGLKELALGPGEEAAPLHRVRRPRTHDRRH